MGAEVSQLVEVWGHHVFVEEPRLFPFSHRNLASLRHPHWPTVLRLDDKQTSKVRRNQPRSERISDLFAENSHLATVATEKWSIVAELFDSKVKEQRVAQLRSRVVESSALRTLIERLWSSHGGSLTKGLYFEQYYTINAVLYRVLLPDVDLTPLQGVITKAIQRDWALDCGGSDEISFGAFYISFLEVLDNWCITANVDNYIDIAEEIIPVLEVEYPRVNASPGLSWEEKAVFLSRNANLFVDPPLVKCVRTVRNTIEYRKVPKAPCTPVE